MLHDTHTHLEMLLEKLDVLHLQDREGFEPNNIPDFPRNILDELLKNHEFVIQATTSTKNFLLTQALFSYNPKINFLIGSHPEIVNEKFDVPKYLEEQKELLTQHGFLQPNLAGELELNSKNHNFSGYNVVGIGECGLDYHYTQDKEIIRKQWDLFESQASLACYLNQPLIIHTRESFADTFAILQKFPQIQDQFVFHCFSGNLKELEQVLEFGGRISVGGIVTFKNAEQLREVVTACPMDKLLIETDLPFLAPTPHRGKVCLPEYVDFIAEQIGALKDSPKLETWQRFQKNSLQFFKKDFV